MDASGTDLISLSPNVLRRSADPTIAADRFDEEGYWQCIEVLPQSTKFMVICGASLEKVIRDVQVRQCLTVI